MKDQQPSWPAAILIAAAFFAATAPTLAWLEFSSTMENLVTASAMEIRRGGSWLLPMLEGEPRIAKPPLATWIAAAGIRSSTLAHLDDPNGSRREAAYRALAWDIRWPALLCSCLILLAVFDLGKTLAGAPIGLIALIVAASSLYLLRFGRQATTDVQLTLWVGIANAAIARLLLKGRSWRAAAVAGVALGLALMSKGPVALLQALAPACLFAGWRRQTRVALAQGIAMLAIMLLVGGAWYGYVFAHVPGVWSRWRAELTRSGLGERAGSLLTYLAILLYLLPWTPAFIHGTVWTAVEGWRARARTMRLPASAEGMIFALLLVLVPLIVMSFFPDRKERYLLPLIGPAAVLTARSLSNMLDDAVRGQRKFRVMQWTTILVIGAGLPIAGATVLKRIGGSPWYPPAFATCAGVFIAMLIVIAIQQSRHSPFLLVIAPAVIMLILAPLFFTGYRDTREGRAEMRMLAQSIRVVAPDAEVYNWRADANKRGDVSLAIYMNRPSIWIADPAKLPASERSQVIVTIARAGEPDPRPGSDWIFLQYLPRDKDRYVAFFRPPQLLHR